MQVLLTRIVCYDRRLDVLCYVVMIKCAQHRHCSCLHIPYGGPLSLQHPARGLHNAKYMHVGSR